MEEIKVGDKVKCNATRSLLGKEIDTTRPYEVEMLRPEIGRAFIYYLYEGFNVAIEDLEPWSDTPEAILRLQIEKLTMQFNELRDQAASHAAKADFHIDRRNDLTFKANEVGAELADMFNEQTKLLGMDPLGAELDKLEERAKASGHGLRFIEHDGVTLAQLLDEDGRVTGKGVAKCSTDDKFDRRVGKVVALRKALGDIFDVTQYGEEKPDIAPGLGFTLFDLRTVNRFFGEGF